MARLIPILSTLPIHMIPNVYMIFAFLLVLSIVSLVTFLCASHHKRQKEEVFTKKKLTISRKNLLESFSKANSISSKALMKIISWRKQVQHDDEDIDYYQGFNNHNNYFFVGDDGYEGEDAVWKKTIIKGERCKPLDFSGKIEYDCEGNLLPDKPVGDKKLKISSKKEVVVS